MSGQAAETDVAIVGAGPVGLFAVFQLGMLGMRATVFDALDALGGQCAALYPEKPIYDIPGLPRVAAGVLVESLAAQARPFAPVYRLGRRAIGLERSAGGGWRVTDEAGEAVTARAVIVAAGGGAFGPNRPPLAGIEEYEGTAVHYHVARRELFRGRRVAIAGGGDSAVDWALSLAEIAAHVMLVHRRERFRALPANVERLRRLAAGGGRLELVVPYQLDGLEGRDGRLTAVRVATLDGETRLLQADFLLPCFGLAMELGPIAGWGLRLERNLVVTDPATAATSLPGVFAIGDIATYPAKLKLILSGFAEAAQAAHAIHPLVFPGQALHFEYSTAKGVPGRE
jgi:thioredoxin reductase (NADPH)